MTVRYDDERIKRPHTEHEYNNEQILALEACSKDIYEFIKFVKIIDANGREILFEPRDYQRKMIDIILNNNEICGLWPRQCGKCVSSKTLIKIRNKKTGKIESVVIKDFFNKIKK